MTSLLLLLLFPLVWPFVARLIWPRQISWKEVGLQAGLMCLVVAMVWGLGRVSKTDDTLLVSGQVTQKHRVHDSYLRSYSCNCYQSCSGSGSNRTCTTRCRTCYERRYTVDWYLSTTIGTIGIQKYDRTSRSVYNSPDPELYARAFVGEPCSRYESYTNYVKAVPDSLFGTISKTTQGKFVGDIPAYPVLYNIYQVNRVLNVKSKVNPTLLRELDVGLDEINKTLGPTKQVNLLMVVTGINDPMYRYAFENNWLGGKKNDVVIFIGTDGEKIQWVDVMTWALNRGNGQFRSTLRDNIAAVGAVDPARIVPVVHDTVKTLYTRPRMEDFKYLSKEVQPSNWVIILCVIIAVFGSLGLSHKFYHTEM